MTETAQQPSIEIAERITVRGLVQGVGFRRKGREQGGVFGADPFSGALPFSGSAFFGLNSSGIMAAGVSPLRTMT